MRLDVHVKSQKKKYLEGKNKLRPIDAAKSRELLLQHPFSKAPLNLIY